MIFFSRAIHLFFLIVLLGCEFNPTQSNQDWNGTDAEFSEFFELINDHNTNETQLLVEKKSGEPFSGEVNRNANDRLTKQNFSKGILEGKSIKFSPDGSWVEAHYINGQLDGTMTFFDAQGQVRSEMLYRKGKRVIPSSE